MPPAADRNEAGTMTRKPGARRDRRTQPSIPKTGREPGKRSNPEYKQCSVLLKKRTHMEVSHTLDKLGGGQDVSELVQELLEQWLKHPPKTP